MTSRATIGEAVVAEVPMTTNQGFCNFLPSPTVEPYFLAYWLRHHKDRLKSLAAGSTFLEINRGVLRKLSIAVPPLPEQKKIATILSSVDEAIQATQAVIDQTRRVKEGLLQDLLTRGVPGHTRFKQTVIGEIPEGWNTELFGNIVAIVDPNPSHRYPPEVPRGVPICSTENFVGDDGYDLSFSKHVADDVFEEQDRRCKFLPSDVVFARKGRIGFARPFGEARKVFSHTVVLIKATERMDPAFVLWLVRSRVFMSDIERRMNSNSGVPTLGVAFLAQVPVPVPSLREQQRISAILGGAHRQLSECERLVEQLRRVKSGLLQDLLTGRVRVTP